MSGERGLLLAGLVGAVIGVAVHFTFDWWIVRDAAVPACVAVYILWQIATDQPDQQRGRSSR